ncbi:MAG: decarboxylating NADP(+)-dependent phosphogluconate dehydrogenase [Sedimentisphaerales bacterium]|nr:decarboxylating NADP(+)-dependent phosphogluconate dehydrogenase [Sedimentisphaerales bacterium]MBN2842983.1 decarboxylating NADP(+)-dependent phosphogluconate dehydrogenase [Sedimentisphaerales bacterium]
MQNDIALIGLAVMGENLILNLDSKGFRVACYNRTTQKVDDFINNRGKGTKIQGFHEIGLMCRSLKSPRKVMMMVKAGAAVDHLIEELLPFLDKGDIIIDGGNSHYPDTSRRVDYLASKGIHFLGTGISGGEEGALKGPSIMPGGSEPAWPQVKEIFQAIAAKAPDGSPCCDWVGKGGAGHFVKMVHNGIEYGDMQLICETYDIMRKVIKLNNEKLAEIFDRWNKGPLDSYLIEITKEIFGHKEQEGKYTVDLIADIAGQKGTGQWTSQAALETAQPLTLVSEAVFARCLSALIDQRTEAAKILPGPGGIKTPGDIEGVLNDLEKALYMAKIVSYAQGFQLMRAVSKQYSWDLNFGNIALLWNGGCIIRSVFLQKIKDAFVRNPKLENLLLDDFFCQAAKDGQQSLRRVVALAVESGIPTPTLSAALSYYDGYRSVSLPINLLQAQRDYFGAHTYQRIDKPRGEFFHTQWF